MKRTALYFIGILAVILAGFAVTSCDWLSTETDELTNTTWVTTGTFNSNANETLYMKFLPDHVISYGPEYQTLKGKYSYDAPNVIITIDMFGVTVRLGGVVASNSMTLSDGTVQMVFRKR